MHIGLIGFGSIGREVHARFRNDRAYTFSALMRSGPIDAPNDLHRVSTLGDLIAGQPDLVVECAGHAAVRDCAVPVLSAGIPMVIASLGALADPALEAAIHKAAKTKGARVIFPSGAIGGLDVLRAVSRFGDVQIEYQGTKPPAAWQGSHAADLVSLGDLREPVAFFKGTGRDAALMFPKNANVIAALALAGSGFETLNVTLVADPSARGNVHSYTVSSPVCSYDMTIHNVPTPGNARTSMTTVLSIEQEIRAFISPAQT